MIQPAYAGAVSRQIFTLAHLPDGPEREPWGVVLCPPVGHEYVNAFRAFRVLATRLASRGVPALRFDYLGTGDSAGETTGVGLADWREDVLTALDYGRETLGLQEMALVGMRLGGTLALEAAAQRDDVTRLVLWEPVTGGAAYLEELDQAYREWLRVTGEELPGIVRGQTDGERFGFLYSRELQRELGALRTLPRLRPDTRVLLIDEGTGAVPPLARELEESGTGVTRHDARPVRVWSRPVGMDRPVVPAEIAGEIVSWLLDRGL